MFLISVSFLCFISTLDRLNANYMMKIVDSVQTIIPESKEEVKEVIIDIVSEPSSSETQSKIVLKTDTGEIYSPKEPIPTEENNVDKLKEEDQLKKGNQIFTIACIDNGLAFPFKYPSDIRSYPFSWAKYFPYFANQPFLPEIKQSILPILQNIEMVNELCEKVEVQLKVFNF